MTRTRGHHGILFGHSRRIADATFSDITGWQPQVSRAAETMVSILSAGTA